jgi:NADPH-dependent curcumin reductase CurA
MTDTVNHQVLLVEKPTGKLGPEHFKLSKGPIPEPKDGEVLLRVRYISLDAANRAWMHGATYRAAVEANTVMAGGGIAEVVASNAPGLQPGDIVFGDTGWQDYGRRAGQAPHQNACRGTADPSAQRLWHCRPHRLFRPDRHRQASARRDGGGLCRRWRGRLHCRPDRQAQRLPGDRHRRRRQDKCAWLTDELGFDAAVDYKDGAVFKALKAAAPGGIDVYFDNVGGDILEACLAQMNLNGRIACCGAISQYDGAPSATGPRGVPGLIVVKRLIMQGFIVMDYMNQREKALTDLQSWVAAGKLKVQEDVIDGLENTPQALIGLLAGENRGKRMVKV